MTIICTELEKERLMDALMEATCVRPMVCPDGKTCEECLEETIIWVTDKKPFIMGKWIPSSVEPSEGKYLVVTEHSIWGKQETRRKDITVANYCNGKWECAWYLKNNVIKYMPLLKDEDIQSW